MDPLIIMALLGGVLVSPVAQTAPPPPRYLGVEQLQEALEGQVSDWTCPTRIQEAHSLRVELRVSRQGEVEWSTTAGAPDPCWSDHLQRLEFRPHQEEEVRAEVSLIIREGRVVAVVGLEREERLGLPVFLHLPMSLGDAQRTALIDALGLASEPLEE